MVMSLEIVPTAKELKEVAELLCDNQGNVDLPLAFKVIEYARKEAKKAADNAVRACALQLGASCARWPSEPQIVSVLQGEAEDVLARRFGREP